MFLDQVYNVNDLGTVREGSAHIPDGDYKAIIESLEGKPTKDGTGQFAEITIRITEGEYQGECLIDRLNLINKSPMAVEIAMRVLADICRSFGMESTPQDLKTLVGKALCITTKNKKQSDWVDQQTGLTVQGQERSEIVKYKAISQQTSTSQSKPFVPPQPATQGAMKTVHEGFAPPQQQAAPEASTPDPMPPSEDPPETNPFAS